MTGDVRLAQIGGTATLGLIGSVIGGYAGVGIGLALGVLLLVVPLRRLTPWSWAQLWLGRNRPLSRVRPVTVINDRSAGGVRYQDGVVAAVVQVLGKAHRPTLLDGPGAVSTDNVLVLDELLPLMHQSLGLRVESLSVVCAGSRHNVGGDYPRVYDTLVGTPHYAGQRETWLIVRINCLDNGAALEPRMTAGTAALATAQRIAASLRCNGLRARVATVTDIVDLEGRLGISGLEPGSRGWHSVRTVSGFLTTYALRTGDISTETLAAMWSLRGEAVTENVTLLADGRAYATIAVQTARPPAAVPSVLLRSLPGQQIRALSGTFCGPRPPLRGVDMCRLPSRVALAVGSSGVLIGRVTGGSRLALPLVDPAGNSHVYIDADDAIVKRIIVRAAGAGERVTVHSSDLERWSSVRMPNVAVVDRPRPDPGSTISVVDGTITPTPRPHTVITVASPADHPPDAADVVIAQSDDSALRIYADGSVYDVDVEFFRAENRYASGSLLTHR